MQQYNRRQSLLYSTLLHGVVLLFAIFGLPEIFPERQDPEPFVMTVEIVPVGEITNLPSSKRPITPDKKPKPTPPKPAPAKPKPVEKAPASKAEPKPEPAPQPDKKLAEIVKKEQKTPEKEKRKAPEENKPKANDDALAALLDQLQKESEANQEKDKSKEKDAGNTTRSDKPYDPTIPLSISEKDAIKSQFIQCWRVPAGARDAHTLAVQVEISMNPDGSVQQAALSGSQRGRYQSDPFFRAAADAAIRAVWKCNPIQHLPPDKYGAWREMELNFDPREMLF